MPSLHYLSFSYCEIQAQSFLSVLAEIHIKGFTEIYLLPPSDVSVTLSM